LVSVPAGTLVDSEKLESLVADKPEPPSVAVQPRLTSVPDHAAGAGSQENVGAFLSIWLPPIGPADAELPTASATVRLPVDAFAVSAPAATLVDNEKLASPALASPEPPSAAVQPIETSAACQTPSAEPQLTAGAFLSILLPMIEAAALELPALSKTVRDPVAAFGSSTPAATDVLSEKLLSPLFTSPDPASEAVHAIETFVACHALSADPQLIVGPAVSRPIVSVAVAEVFPAASLN
jgi:hypothetical protein